MSAPCRNDGLLICASRAGLGSRTDNHAAASSEARAVGIRIITSILLLVLRYQPKSSQNRHSGITSQGASPRIDGAGYHPRIEVPGSSPRIDTPGSHPRHQVPASTRQDPVPGYHPRINATGSSPRNKVLAAAHQDTVPESTSQEPSPRNQVPASTYQDHVPGTRSTSKYGRACILHKRFVTLWPLKITTQQMTN